MPYKSTAQMAFMHAKHPDIAARWDKEYHQTGKGLPRHVKKKKTMLTSGGGKTALTGKKY